MEDAILFPEIALYELIKNNPPIVNSKMSRSRRRRLHNKDQLRSLTAGVVERPSSLSPLSKAPDGSESVVSEAMASSDSGRRRLNNKEKSLIAVVERPSKLWPPSSKGSPDGSESVLAMDSSDCGGRCCSEFDGRCAEVPVSEKKRKQSAFLISDLPKGYSLRPRMKSSCSSRI